MVERQKREKTKQRQMRSRQTEGQTDRQTNTKLKCTVKHKRPPGNCDGPTGMPDNDAVGC